MRRYTYEHVHLGYAFVAQVMEMILNDLVHWHVPLLVVNGFVTCHLLFGRIRVGHACATACPLTIPEPRNNFGADHDSLELTPHQC